MKETLWVFGCDRAWHHGESNAGESSLIRSSERAFTFQQLSLAKTGPVKRMGRRGTTHGTMALCFVSYVYVLESTRPSFVATRVTPGRPGIPMKPCPSSSKSSERSDPTIGRSIERLPD